VLRRRPKRRYIAVMFDPDANNNEQNDDVVTIISRRNKELFGSIAKEKSMIKFIRNEAKGVVIISCRWDYTDQLLTTIAFVCPSMVTIDASGSVKKLRRRVWVLPMVNHLQK